MTSVEVPACVSKAINDIFVGLTDVSDAILLALAGRR